MTDAELIAADVLRTATAPVSVDAIAQQIVQAKGLSGLTSERMGYVRERVKEALGRLREAGEVWIIDW